MNPSRTLVARVAALTAICALAAGCASAPDAPPSAAAPSPERCAAIAQEMAKTLEMRRTAVETNETAWRTIVPVVVVARKTSARSAIASADRRLAELKDAAGSCEVADGR